MRLFMAAALLASTGCAPAVFHDGRTTLARSEQACLAPRKGATSGIFFEVLPATGIGPLPRTPAGALQAIRSNRVSRIRQQVRTSTIGRNRGHSTGSCRFQSSVFVLQARQPFVMRITSRMASGTYRLSIIV